MGEADLAEIDRHPCELEPLIAQRCPRGDEFAQPVDDRGPVAALKSFLEPVDEPQDANVAIRLAALARG